MGTLYNVKAQTLLDTLAGTVSKAKDKTLGNTVANVEVKRLVDSRKRKRRETPGDVKAKALVNASPDTPVGEKAETMRHNSDLGAEILVVRLASRGGG